MNVHDAIKRVEDLWKRKEILSEQLAETLYESLFGNYLRPHAFNFYFLRGTMSDPEPIRRARICLNLLSTASWCNDLRDQIMALEDPMNFSSVEPIHKHRKDRICPWMWTRSFGRVLSTNGSTGDSVQYHFGPYFYLLQNHIETMKAYPDGCSKRVFFISISGTDQNLNINTPDRDETNCVVTTIRSSPRTVIESSQRIAADIAMNKPCIVGCTPGVMAALSMHTDNFDGVTFVCTGERVWPFQRALVEAMGGHIIDEMRAWDSGLTFTTNHEGRRIFFDDLFNHRNDAKGVFYTHDFWNFATATVNYANGDMVDDDGNIMRPIESEIFEKSSCANVWEACQKMKLWVQWIRHRDGSLSAWCAEGMTPDRVSYLREVCGEIFATRNDPISLGHNNKTMQFINLQTPSINIKSSFINLKPQDLIFSRI